MLLYSLYPSTFKAYKTSLSIEKEFLSHKSIDTQG